MEDISNKTLAALLSVAIIISLVGTYMASQSGVVYVGMPVDYQSNGTATASYSIDDIAEITVTQNIDFRSGKVNAGQPDALLDSAATSAVRGNWTWTDLGAQYIVINNTGTVDLNLTVRSNVTNVEFIPGPSNASAQFNYTFLNNIAGSCETGLNANSTAFTTDYVEVCEVFQTGSANSLNMSVQLLIPANTNPGSRVALLEFQGTGLY